MPRSRAAARSRCSAPARRCRRAARGDRVVVGSKNFTEQLVLGEMYAQILDRTRPPGRAPAQPRRDARSRWRRCSTRRHRSLPRVHRDRADRRTAPAAAAGRRGDLSHRESRVRDNATGCTWLDPAPMNNTQALATTRAIARRYAVTHAEPVERAPHRNCGSGRFPSSRSAPDGFPACSAPTAAFVSRTCGCSTSG